MQHLTFEKREEDVADEEVSTQDFLPRCNDWLKPQSEAELIPSVGASSAVRRLADLGEPRRGAKPNP